MKTRRNFLKTSGLVGAFIFNSKNLISKENNEEIIYGSEMIRNVLDEYKRKRPVKYEKYSILSEVDSIFLEDNDVRLVCGYPELQKFNMFDVLIIKDYFIPHHKPDWVRGSTSIFNDEKGFYVIKHPNNLDFREESGGLVYHDNLIMHFPNPEKVFKPYKELYSLVWEDVKLYKKTNNSYYE